MLAKLLHRIRLRLLLLEGSVRIWHARRVFDRHLDGAYEELQRYGPRPKPEQTDPHDEGAPDTA